MIAITDEAIKYLKISSRRVDQVELQKQVSERIDSLRKQQFKKESAIRTKFKDKPHPFWKP